MVILQEINTGERSALKGACCVRRQAVGYQLGRFVNFEPAYKSRCWQSSLLDVDYPDEFTELMILEQVVPDLPVLVREKMVKLAHEIRGLFVGNQEGEAQLSCTLSTRGLVRWARLSLRFQGAPRVFEYALEQTLTARVEPAERQAIHRIGHDVFGELWTGGNEL